VKLSQFRVYNYRNINDSGPIETGRITAMVGQNESGKSNLFEALYRLNPYEQQAAYSLEEDWPADLWSDKDPGAKVCEARFALEESEIAALFGAAAVPADPDAAARAVPQSLTLHARSSYGGPTSYYVDDANALALEAHKVSEWARSNVPKFVYIQDYQMSGGQIELNALQQRRKSVSWEQLSVDEQTMLIILDLAHIDLDDFLSKGDTPTGRTARSFDKRSASAYLTKQFQSLWRQKSVRFDIEVDGTTLNIFVEDEGVGMPIRLSRRSTGFRWYVGFAWKFTHASKGQFKNCVVLLEEPGIHLHPSAQADLLQVLERLSEANSILYTTHLASMLDLGSPERIRIVETQENHATVKQGVVSSQRGPMAVIETSLGLTGDLSGLMANRKSLIVEGGDDALILQKLSALLATHGKTSLADDIYLWPVLGALQTPMYAAFAIGQKWQSGVLLHSDAAGESARKKINELFLSRQAETDAKRFRVIMLKQAAHIGKGEVGIEDLFPDEFYLALVNAAYRIQIQMSDLPADGSAMIAKRIEQVLVSTYGCSGLDKGAVLAHMLRAFETWRSIGDIPPLAVTRAELLFEKINFEFAS
jgi:energy-coupling factor transporter ATP-binding protein EcfA2